MKHRLNFKIIGTLIILSFISLVAIQWYWLSDMYKSAKEQNIDNIKQAIERADHKELLIRVTALKEKGVLKEHTLDFKQSLDSDMSTKNIKKNNVLETKLIEVYEFLKKLPGSLMQEIHNTADPLLPVNYRVLDSLLNIELASKNIHSKAFTKVYANDDLINNPDIPAGNGADSLKGAYRLQYEKFALAPAQQLFVYVLNPNKEIIIRMRGILLSSALVLLLVIITFVYLFRTIIKQKTVEELKTDFTNNMTHELKTPVAAGYAAIDALLQSAVSPATDIHPLPADKFIRYLGIAKGQLVHLSGLVEKLLSLTAENRSTFMLRPEPVLIEEIITQLIELHSISHNKKCVFKISCPSGTEIIGDRTHIYNMLNNLIENAVKYCMNHVAEIEITVCRQAGSVTISVAENRWFLNGKRDKKTGFTYSHSLSFGTFVGE